MALDQIPRVYSFSLGDFYNFERCFFGFLVKHHLQKKYELEEGSPNKTLGSILDLAIKKLHMSKAYSQPVDYLSVALINAAVADIKAQAEKEGLKSFYGGTTAFLTPELIEKARVVFKNYWVKKGGRINPAILAKDHMFWRCILNGNPSTGSGLYQIWGGPDALEMGEGEIPEVVDYKYFEDPKVGKSVLDMDLMPKIYVLLCAQDLSKMGFKKARFRIRSWQEPLEESLYEEFDLSMVEPLKEYLRHKIEKILSITELSFCEKPYCKVCNSPLRSDWIKELQTQFNFS